MTTTDVLELVIGDRIRFSLLDRRPSDAKVVKVDRGEHGEPRLHLLWDEDGETTVSYAEAVDFWEHVQRAPPHPLDAEEREREPPDTTSRPVS